MRSADELPVFADGWLWITTTRRVGFEACYVALVIECSDLQGMIPLSLFEQPSICSGPLPVN